MGQSAEITSQTRDKLEIITQKSEELQSWRFYKHYNERGFSININLGGIDAGGGVAVDKGGIPDKEALIAVINNLRFFSLGNEDICLFNDGWVPSNPRRQRGQCRPDWLSDPALDANWLGWWNDTQSQINSYLGETPLDVGLTWDFESQQRAAWGAGTPVTNGILYDVFAFGDATHTTKRAAFRAWQNDEYLFAHIEMELYCVVSTLIRGVGRVGYVSRLLLDDKPIPAPTGSAFTKYRYSE